MHGRPSPQLHVDSARQVKRPWRRLADDGSNAIVIEYVSKRLIVVATIRLSTV